MRHVNSTSSAVTGVPLKVSRGDVPDPYGLDSVPETNAFHWLEPGPRTLISKSLVLAKVK